MTIIESGAPCARCEHRKDRHMDPLNKFVVSHCWDNDTDPDGQPVACDCPGFEIGESQ
jgi:hypothetical protein